MFQLIERILRTAHGKEFQIPLHCRLTFAENHRRKSRSAGIARRIYIDIERIVEVRDACPLILHRIIPYQFRAEIQLNQFLVQRIERRTVQRLTALCHRMCFLLKFRKHRLTVDGSLEPFQILIQQSQTVLRIRLLCQKLLNQKILIDGRSNFGNEHRIAAVLVRLRMIGKPCMLAVPHFVGNR